MSISPTEEAKTLPSPLDSEDVAVPTRWGVTWLLAIWTLFMCAAYISTVEPTIPRQTNLYIWIALGYIALIPFVAYGFYIRKNHPEHAFWLSCAGVSIFPFSPLYVQIMLASTLSRRRSRKVALRTIPAAAAVSIFADIRDVLCGPDGSFWYRILSSKDKQGHLTEPLQPVLNPTGMIILVCVISLTGVVIATFVGHSNRTRAELRAATDKAKVAQQHASELKNTLDSHQVIDAIAAEAHDTLAHSLSLLAINASALHASAKRLAAMTESSPLSSGQLQQVEKISESADEIRKQAAGALDEAHSIIEMLRNPGIAMESLEWRIETSLSREAISNLLSESRDAGMDIDSWIDIDNLGSLHERVSKVAFRAIQEGLTNARRHAPGERVELEITANPEVGVRIAVSNHLVKQKSPQNLSIDTLSENTPPSTQFMHGAEIPISGGNGLIGISERVRAIGGKCGWTELDGKFELRIILPWIQSAQ